MTQALYAAMATAFALITGGTVLVFSMIAGEIAQHSHRAFTIFALFSKLILGRGSKGLLITTYEFLVPALELSLLGRLVVSLFYLALGIGMIYGGVSIFPPV